jgi:type I restriction enzyme M protein
MLDTDTKRRIDTARDILVGKVPDPKSQVEQITIALIYKFMDDMDAEAEELGGKRKFFAGHYARYGWARLMRSGLGGHETLNLYAEAIAKMPENPGIPPLFRDIFKNAYLPYRDPETLRAFLKIVDEFTYDHSERLGDAFEYLLSVLGSQGDAGQFRTPRHIIDFMVAIVDPKKSETVLDPACGTAGFLISSWKHILKANTDATGHSTLTPDDKGRLAQNFKGYDISPDMVRLSLVNLYLHGFTDPHIFEYDTLTSQDRWNEHADVILANPPFMSPKGGIKPHNRFSVQSKRSEVLFVDYMAEHLTPRGRAGIIVPEGIIFQSQTAYTQLRKMLVEEYLVAVVSLPAGVFNPYSGVKTSILILDKSLARQAQTIAFFTIENDGFGLGAQRREISKNDLPQARAEIAEYLRRLRALESADDFQSARGLVVPKNKIAATGEYNLSGERYREIAAVSAAFPIVPLGDVCDVIKGSPITRGQVIKGTVPVIAGGQQPSCHHNTANRTGETITVSASGAYAGFLAYFDQPIFASDCSTITVKDQRLVPKFLFRLLKSKQQDIYGLQVGMGQPHVYPKDLVALQIPLPPIAVQKQIVAEIEGYQKVIDGARAVLDNYRPHIATHADWPLIELSDVSTKITDGAHFTPTYIDDGVPFLRVTDITESNTSKKFIPREEHEELIKRCRPEKGDILYSKNGTIGIAKLIDWEWEFSIFVSLCLIKPKRDVVDPQYLTCFLNSDMAYAQATARSKSGTVTNLHLVDIKTIKIPVPPRDMQRAIVAEIEAEKALVSANRELIARFEKKIQAAMSRVWGDDE